MQKLEEVGGGSLEKSPLWAPKVRGPHNPEGVTAGLPSVSRICLFRTPPPDTSSPGRSWQTGARRSECVCKQSWEILAVWGKAE